MFEVGCEEMGLGDNSKKVSLMGRLKGSAAAWAQGLRHSMYTMTYSEMKGKLLAHFQGETMGHVRRL